MGRKKRSRVSEEGIKENATGEGRTLGAGDSSASSGKSLYEVCTFICLRLDEKLYALSSRGSIIRVSRGPSFVGIFNQHLIVGVERTATQQGIKKAYYKLALRLHPKNPDDEALVGDVTETLQGYFRTMYKQVTEADIEEFEASYRGSEFEKKYLKDLYGKFNGNMNRLFCSMICSDTKLGSHRYKDIIDEAIAEGELKTSKAYQK